MCQLSGEKMDESQLERMFNELDEHKAGKIDKDKALSYGLYSYGPI